MLARSAVEVLFLGLYCVREPGAVDKLHAGNVKAVADALAMAAATGIVSEDVIRECVAALGEPARKHLGVKEMVDAVDKDNGNTAALTLYRTLYGPLSNFTVHASGGTLLRHVSRNGKLRARPSRSWSRRSAMHVADAVTGALASQLARHQKKPDDDLARYMNRHFERAILPLAFMAVSGIRGKVKPRALREFAAMIKDVYRYLWKGQAVADSHEARVAYVRERFAAVLNMPEADLPPGALDPFINHVAEMMAGLVDRLPKATSPATAATGSDLSDTDAA